MRTFRGRAAALVTARHLPLALVAYVGASLLHHMHNAQFLDRYPGMPGWLPPAAIYGAWVIATSLGLVGYFLWRRGQRLLGFGLLAAYAVYGLDSLAHYWLAPLSAHSLGMNVTIWLEVAAATALLAVIFSMGRAVRD